MTNLVDFDRSLAEFLADGPNTAPEAPVVAALAHARTTPRRPDPLRAFRSDVMAAPRRVFGLRPGFVLAAAALVVASIGVAVVGSSQNQVQPSPSGPVPSGGPSVPPVGPPSFSATVSMKLAGGVPMVVTVGDLTGNVIEATSLQPGGGVSVPEGIVQVAADPSDPSALVITWMGSPCERTGDVSVDEPRKQIVVARELCTGETDAVAFDRVLRVRFKTAINASDWSGIVVAGPSESTGPGESEPPAPSASDVDFQLRVDTFGGRPMLLDVVDDSGHVTAAAAGESAAGEGTAPFSATNTDARVVRVSWHGSTCDVISRLIVAADFGLRLERPGCNSEPNAIVRTVVLTFDRDVNADAFDTGLEEVDDWSVYPWAVNGTDSAGGQYNLRVSPLSQGLQNVATMDASSSQPSADERIRLDQAGDDIVELVWTSPACDTTPTLNFDTSGTHWLLSESGCAGVALVVRRVSLKFDGPHPVGSIQVTLVPAASGS